MGLLTIELVCFWSGSPPMTFPRSRVNFFSRVDVLDSWCAIHPIDSDIFHIADAVCQHEMREFSPAKSRQAIYIPQHRQEQLSTTEADSAW